MTGLTRIIENDISFYQDDTSRELGENFRATSANAHPDGLGTGSYSEGAMLAPILWTAAYTEAFHGFDGESYRKVFDILSNKENLSVHIDFGKAALKKDGKSIDENLSPLVEGGYFRVVVDEERDPPVNVYFPAEKMVELVASRTRKSHNKLLRENQTKTAEEL